VTGRECITVHSSSTAPPPLRGNRVTNWLPEGSAAECSRDNPRVEKSHTFTSIGLRRCPPTKGVMFARALSSMRCARRLSCLVAHSLAPNEADSSANNSADSSI
jgi:hypothetical protein